MMKQPSVPNSRSSVVQELPTYRVQVLERAFAILDLLANRHACLGLAEISRHLGLNKTTALRLLSVLEHHRYLERVRGNSSYCLGSKLFELGTKSVSRLDLFREVRPFLQRLVEETGETAHVGVLRNGEVVSLANVESPRTLRTPATVGKRSPAHCTSIGKAILAFGPKSEVEELARTHGLEKFTSNTITAMGALQVELGRIRKLGYAIDDEEYERGLRCLGAPVRDYTSEVIGALSVTGPAIRITSERIAALGKLVLRAANQLSVQLGYQYHEDTVVGRRIP